MPSSRFSFSTVWASPYTLPLLLAAVYLVRTGLAVFVFGYRPVDDSFITYRYALNWAEGHGLVYNVGEAVLGTTAPLWALVLGTGAKLGLDIQAAAFHLSLAADGVTALAIVGLLHRLNMGRAAGYGAALLFLLQVDALTLSRTGMETAFFLSLVMTTLYFTAAHRWGVAGGLAVLATLTRPEGALLVIVFAALGALYIHRTGRWRPVLGGVAVLGGLGLLWLAVTLSVYGSPVPHSIIAKAHNTAEADGRLWLSTRNLMVFFAKGQLGNIGWLQPAYVQGNVLLTLLSGVGAASLATAAVRGANRAWDAVWLLFFFPAAFLGGYGLSAAFTYYAWYYAPLYLFLSIFAVLGARAIAARLPMPRAQTWAIGGLVLMLAAGQTIATLTVKRAAGPNPWIEHYRAVVAPIPRDPTVPVAATEIGVVGWEVWPAPVIDLVGLVSPTILTTDPEPYVRTHTPPYVVSNDTRTSLRWERLPWFADVYQPLDRRYGHNRVYTSYALAAPPSDRPLSPSAPTAHAPAPESPLPR